MKSPFPSKNILDYQTKINRLKAKRASLETTLKNQEKSKRLSRTRTLIQVGGLINMFSFLKRFDLNLGDDLQLDEDKKDKALMFLGFLSEVENQTPATFTDEQKLRFKLKGQAILNAKSQG